MRSTPGLRAVGLAAAVLVTAGCPLFVDSAPATASHQSCPCPGGHTGALDLDAEGQQRCACLVQFPTGGNPSRELVLRDARAAEIRRFVASETIDMLAYFLPAQGLFIATQQTDGCGPSLFAFSLETGRSVRRLTDAGSCLKGLIASSSGRRLSILQDDAQDSGLVLTTYESGSYGEIHLLSRAELGRAMANVQTSILSNDRDAIVPLVVWIGTTGTERLHRVVKVDLESGALQVLFELPPEQALGPLHVTDGILVAAVNPGVDPQPAWDLRSYDTDSGDLLQTISGHLLSRRGRRIVIRDELDQVRIWEPAAAGQGLSQSLGTGGRAALVAEDALAVTGMPPAENGTWVFRISSGEQVMAFDGSQDIDAGERLVALPRFVSADGRGLLQINMRCQADTCEASSVMLLRTDRPRLDLAGLTILNSLTILLVASLDASQNMIWSMQALDLVTLDLSDLGRIDYELHNSLFMAPGVDSPVW